MGNMCGGGCMGNMCGGDWTFLIDIEPLVVPFAAVPHPQEVVVVGAPCQRAASPELQSASTVQFALPYTSAGSACERCSLQTSWSTVGGSVLRSAWPDWGQVWVSNRSACPRRCGPMNGAAGDAPVGVHSAEVALEAA